MIVALPGLFSYLFFLCRMLTGISLSCLCVCVEGGGVRGEGRCDINFTEVRSIFLATHLLALLSLFFLPLGDDTNDPQGWTY